MNSSPYARGEMGDASRVQSAFEAFKNHIVTHKIEMTLWGTRILTIIFTMNYFIPFIGHPYSMYNKALIANAATNALRLHQRHHSRMTFSSEFFATIFLEDSCHYIIYSFIFLYVRPFALVLMPVFFFSLIHSVNYSLKLLDALGQNSWFGTRLLTLLLDTQSRNILNIIAYTEITLMPFTILLLIMGRAGFGTPFLYQQFLTLRYKSQRNPFTRNAFRDMRVSLEILAIKPQTPYVIRKIILTSIQWVCKFSPHERNQGHAPAH